MLVHVICGSDLLLGREDGGLAIAPESPFGKIPAEQCRQLPQMRFDVANLVEQCAQLPGPVQAQCRALIAVSQPEVKAMEAGCAIQ